MSSTATDTLNTHLQQLAEYDTALLANLLRFVDPTPTHLMYMSSEIRSLISDVGPTVGVAYTCELDSSSPDEEGEGNTDGFWQQIAAMESSDLAAVWVVSCIGRRPQHECVMGDGMGKALAAGGCMGVVTDGGVRDLNGLRSIGFGAFGSGVAIHHCKLRMRGTDLPVELGGIAIHPGDVIHANAEGVIRIPHAAVPKLLEQAPAYRAFEHEAHQLLRRTDVKALPKRERLQEMIAKYGFRDCTTVAEEG